LAIEISAEKTFWLIKVAPSRQAVAIKE